MIGVVYFISICSSFDTDNCVKKELTLNFENVNIKLHFIGKYCESS